MAICDNEAIREDERLAYDDWDRFFRAFIPNLVFFTPAHFDFHDFRMDRQLNVKKEEPREDEEEVKILSFIPGTVS